MTGVGIRMLLGGAVVLSAVALATAWNPVAASAASPTVTVDPAPSAGPYHDGQTVTVSVGPNSLFSSNHRIVILECADPGGTTANLPTDFNSCDGNTTEADTVLVQANGSFTEKAFPLYALPSATLGERPTWEPVCNTTSKCVLFVGEDQNDFSQPKVFSAPFTFSSAGTASTAATSTTGTTSTTTVAPSNASAGVSLPSATLAFTGSSGALPCLAAAGLALLGAGDLARRRLKRRVR